MMDIFINTNTESANGAANGIINNVAYMNDQAPTHLASPVNISASPATISFITLDQPSSLLMPAAHQHSNGNSNNPFMITSTAMPPMQQTQIFNIDESTAKALIQILNQQQYQQQQQQRFQSYINMNSLMQHQQQQQQQQQQNISNSPPLQAPTSLILLNSFNNGQTNISSSSCASSRSSSISSQTAPVIQPSILSPYSLSPTNNATNSIYLYQQQLQQQQQQQQPKYQQCLSTSTSSTLTSPTSPTITSPIATSNSSISYASSTTSTSSTSSIASTSSSSNQNAPSRPLQIPQPQINMNMLNVNSNNAISLNNTNRIVMSQENLNQQQQQQQHQQQPQQQQQQQIETSTINGKYANYQQQQQQQINTTNLVVESIKLNEAPKILINPTTANTVNSPHSQVNNPIVSNNNGLVSFSTSNIVQPNVTQAATVQQAQMAALVTTTPAPAPPNSVAANPAPIVIAPSATNNNVNNISNSTESGDETEEENEIVEEGRDGRWSKRNHSVSQRDVPGIDKAYLAMDTENGFEVVWNEINLTNGKKFKNQEFHNDEKNIDEIFKNLISLNHPNIVKFHDYWIDPNEHKKRIVFITEYMSSGSLKQFLRKAKKTNQSIKKQTWKRWCIQLLSALHYLHNSQPTPIIHDDLSCDTIYIQHNGLIKIGSIAPDIVHKHVKTCISKKFIKNLHFIAPEANEYSLSTNTATSEEQHQLDPTSLLNRDRIKSTAVDIYAFGMVALEMFNLEFGGNGDTHPVTPDLIKQAIDALDEKQRDFIQQCLQADPRKRPTAQQLLFHPLLFEVPSLRLLASHQIINNQNSDAKELQGSDLLNSRDSTDRVIATYRNSFDYKFSQLPTFDANKYLEDVRNGIYPLTAFGLLKNNNNITNTTLTPTTTQKVSRDNQKLSQMPLIEEKESSPAAESLGISQQNITLSSSSTNLTGQNQNTNQQQQQIANVSNLSSISSSPASSSNLTNLNLTNDSTNANANNNNLLSAKDDELLENSLSNELPSNMQQTQQHQLNPNDPNPAMSSSSSTSSSPPPPPQQILNQQTLTNNLSRTQSPNNADGTENNTNLEKRIAQKMDSNLMIDKNNYQLTLKITFDDKTARLIRSQMSRNELTNVIKLADELVSFGLVNEVDKKTLCDKISETIQQAEKSITNSLNLSQQQFNMQQQQYHQQQAQQQQL